MKIEVNFPPDNCTIYKANVSREKLTPVDQKLLRQPPCWYGLALPAQELSFFVISRMKYPVKNQFINAAHVNLQTSADLG